MKKMADNMRKCCCGGGELGDVGDIKSTVKARYAQVARGASCCCGASDDPITQALYSDAESSGIPLEALAASAGCANPVALADINPGDVVLDLGSGGGIDVLLSAKRVGSSGKVYGLDMTDEMLELARKNQAKAGVTNVEFIKGEIEDIPLPDSSVDVIISNCVINLSVDKPRVLSEAFRVLKPGGRFAVADIVLTRPIPESLRGHFALWTGCISGALLMDEYKQYLEEAGFSDIDIEIFRTYSAADVDGFVSEDLRAEIGEDQIAALADSFASAFIRAVKPQF